MSDGAIRSKRSGQEDLEAWNKEDNSAMILGKVRKLWSVLLVNKHLGATYTNVFIIDKENGEALHRAIGRRAEED